MNRSIHFRASDTWIEKATNRAKSLGLDLSEYIRSTISKDFEEGKKMFVIFEEVYRKEIGKCTKLGTDYPVENVVYRQKLENGINWYAVKGLCNDIPDDGKNFKTKKEAIEWVETQNVTKEEIPPLTAEELRQQFEEDI